MVAGPVRVRSIGAVVDGRTSLRDNSRYEVRTNFPLCGAGKFLLGDLRAGTRVAVARRLLLLVGPTGRSRFHPGRFGRGDSRPLPGARAGDVVVPVGPPGGGILGLDPSRREGARRLRPPRRRLRILHRFLCRRRLGQVVVGQLRLIVRGGVRLDRDGGVCHRGRFRSIGYSVAADGVECGKTLHGGMPFFRREDVRRDRGWRRRRRGVCRRGDAGHGNGGGTNVLASMTKLALF
mmetsp:Transcript_32514/g.78701  ORF Transcript_32514/g.78701 Transcript_32514/m.78701 type:complete len:235 (-) Transcript_32514:287-991(-)